MYLFVMLIPNGGAVQETPDIEYLPRYICTQHEYPETLGRSFFHRDGAVITVESPPFTRASSIWVRDLSRQTQFRVERTALQRRPTA